MSERVMSEAVLSEKSSRLRIGRSIGAVLAGMLGPAFGPHWYPLALIVLAIPQSWAGGKLRVMQLHARVDS